MTEFAKDIVLRSFNNPVLVMDYKKNGVSVFSATIDKGKLKVSDMSFTSDIDRLNKIYGLCHN